MGAPKRAAVLLAATLGLLAGLAFSWYAFGLRSVVGAFLFNWLPLSWPPTVRTAFLLRLPEGYHRLRPWERGGRLYERVGVRWFLRLLRTPLLGVLNRDIPRAFRSRDYAQAEREMRLAEASHAVVFAVVMLIAGVAAVLRWWDAAAYLVGWDILLNAYPVVVQRYNRGRLARLVGKRLRRSDRSTEGGPVPGTALCDPP